jgi:TPP-dependent indolepyruvate ferredoxin oxidoreductase alpha subunit
MTLTVSQTIARALLDAGVKVVTYVPGYGSNEVFEDYNQICLEKHPMSFHEEVAFSIAHGCSMVGSRSASLLKSHGVIKAGNSLSDSLYSGTTAGLVVLIFNDNNGQQSDSILDIWSFLKGIGISYINADKDNLYRQIISLFEQSEKRNSPCALVVESSEVLQPAAGYKKIKLNNHKSEYHRDIAQRVLCPFFLDYQNQILQSKNRYENWREIPKPEIPKIPGSLPEKWHSVAALYDPVFSEFRSIRGSLVIGDTGVSTLFACEPYNCIDITTYMGGSLPLAIGAYLAGYRDVWAVTGDFSFIAAGHLGLLEAWHRQIPLKVLIFDNGKAETTGGQPVPAETLVKILKGYENNISVIHNPDNHREIAAVLAKATKSNQMNIVIADYNKK